MQKISALELAEFILASYPNKNIYPMKLQKLAWYAKVWSVVSEENCVDAVFKKWDFGPVNTQIYHKYKTYSKQPIPTPSSTDETKQIDHETSAFLKFILDNYIDLSAVALSSLTHNEQPWIKTSSNKAISDVTIKEFYSKQSFAKNFLNKKWNEGKYWVLKTNSWHSFTLDMSEKEAMEYESFDSFFDYLQHKEEAKKTIEEIWKTSELQF